MGEIVLRDGSIVYGKLLRSYCSVEGDMRYIFYVAGRGEIRCNYDNMNSNYREYVA